MHNKTRIQGVSRRFRFLCVGLIFCIPIADTLYWLFFNYLPDGLFELPVAVSYELSFGSRLLAFLVSLIPVSVATYGVLTLARLFRLYENAVIFTAENVKHVRTLGYVLLLWVVARVMYTPLISAVLSFTNPSGQRMLAARFDLFDFTLLIIGAIVVLIARVMDEGRKLEDDQAYTI